MSNTITGDEPYFPYVARYNFKIDINEGATLRQHALLQFMCTLLGNPNRGGSAEDYAKDADEFVTAYINQLNKQP